ncbi:short-chain fatty acid transporter [Brevibacterium album]|uniref:short-chain fatty acid transporter n=1 Tax=Brevibacterium album TaxID=417948 RepID=UPI000404A560|nr:TIGR00366 family protein [Brevibacterium album]
MKTLARSLNIAVERWLPSSFLFAIVLTLLTALLGITAGGASPLDMAGHWYSGFWDFLEFGMQMTLIIVTGYALAKAPLVARLLRALASRPRTQRSALSVVMLSSAAAGIISWGLGFVFGTLLAIEVARACRKADFRLLIAASYTAVIATQPMSITLTAPLLVNTPGNPFEEQIGLIPVTETIFSPTMIAVSLLGFAGVYCAYLLMAPAADDVVPFAGQERQEERQVPAGAASAPRTPAERINDSRILGGLIVLLGLTALGLYVAENGVNLELNIMNLTFLVLGLALHGSPERYMRTIGEGISAAAGIVVQFPFYAGIIGMMGGAGLIVLIGGWFASASTEATFPVLTLVSAMIVNIFVPSAGGQWLVQGPVMLEASRDMAVPAATVVNAVSVGDMVTNLLQPFFVLPALGLSGLALKDIWGYCMTAMTILIVVSCTVFLVFPLLGW